MTRYVNKVAILGNLGQDPEVRHTHSDAKIVHLSVATADVWKDKETGERREHTEWHRVVIHNLGLADVAEQYLKKGSKVYLKGALRTRQWQDQDGITPVCDRDRPAALSRRARALGPEHPRPRRCRHGRASHARGSRRSGRRPLRSEATSLHLKEKAMSADLIMSAVPGMLRRSSFSKLPLREYELFGERLGGAVVAIKTVEDAATAIATFGRKVHARHPERSFAILARIREGHRKPRGFDAACRSDTLGLHAFMRLAEEPVA